MTLIERAITSNEVLIRKDRGLDILTGSGNHDFRRYRNNEKCSICSCIRISRKQPFPNSFILKGEVFYNEPACIVYHG